MQQLTTMNMNSYMPVKLFTGPGCVKQHAEEFLKLGKKPLIVTGKTSALVCGALPDVTAAIAGAGGRYVVFDGIGQNPALTDCMKAAAEAVAAGCDYIIGIGGGSPLDAAKCIAVLTANPGMTEAELYSLNWPAKPLPVAVVGTTAGTGSEVTKVSVITTPAGRKKSFHHEDVYPRIAFGDPAYTMSLSREFSISTAIDALSHATESFFSRKANDISQCYALQAVRMLLPVLRKIAEMKADEMQINASGLLSCEDREILYHASLYAGLAINITGTCLPHAMGYLLTEQHKIPHGYACAVFLRDFLRINEREVPDLVALFFREIGYGQAEYLALTDALLQAVRRHIADDVPVTEEEIAREHGRWVGNGSVAKGWGNISAEECDEILRSFCRY